MKDVTEDRVEVLQEGRESFPFDLCVVRLYTGDVIKLNSKDEPYVLYGYEEYDDEITLKLTRLSSANDKKFEIGFKNENYT